MKSARPPMPAWVALVMLAIALPAAGETSVPATQPAPPAIEFTDADFQAHVEQVRQRLATIEGGQRFSIVVERPFVVIGDEPESTLRAHARGTVRWAVTMLKKDFFTRDPETILEVWLFRDATSYTRHCKLIFNDEPGTPYGYYSARHQALIMNIATGGGTLVHEIVHPFMAANFPECPAWLNEGLGSLYEQSAERDGHIIGRTNWRLAGLKQAIRGRDTRSFKSLLATSDDEFYGQGSGVHYAQARYLCYYLQENDLLVRYYHEFQKNAADDPTGYDTLVKILREPDMAAFQKRWEKYVLSLRFP